MQETGIANNLYELAVLNGLSITQVMQLDENVKTVEAVSKKIVKLFAGAHKPASSFDEDGPPETVKLEGIDYWYVWEYVVQ
jgi:hypothetical protein